MPEITIKRIYEPFSPQDGLRVLVDRLWPRGMSRENAHVDLWLREIAPSDGLRRWFGHKPERWQVFQERYMVELAAAAAARTQLVAAMAGHDLVTLLYAAKDPHHNNATALKAFLESNPPA